MKTTRNLRDNIFGAATAVIGAAMLSACAGSGGLSRAGGGPPAILRPIPQGSVVLIIGLGAGALNDVEAEKDGKSGRTGARIVGGTAGGVGGVAVGAGYGLAASGACGPLFFICAPFTVTVGAIAGGVNGATLGTAVGSASGAAIDAWRRSRPGKNPEGSQEQVEKLETAIIAIGAELGLSQPLVDAFRRRGQDRWTVVDLRDRQDLGNAGKGPVIALKVDQLGLAATEDGNLFVDMKSSMIVSYTNPAGTTSPVPFTYQSSAHELEYWVADESAELRAEISRGLEHQATEIITLLDSIGHD